jgi:HK97 family phage major capsid protein
MPTILELRAQRKNLIEQARAILKTAEERPEGERELTAEERANYDKAFGDAGKLKDTIDSQEREEKLAAEERDLAASLEDDPPKPGTGEGDDPEKRDKGDAKVGRRGQPEYRAAFQRMIQTGIRSFGPAELRAIQADDDIKAGYLVASEQFVSRLIEDVKNLVFVRQYATVESLTSARSLGAPSLDADVADPAWTAEVGAVSEDSTLAVGRRNWEPHQLTKLVKVAEKLLRLSAGGAERLVRDRLAYKFAVTLENAYLNGTGAQQPLGVFVANAAGISTSRDLSTDNTTTAFTADNLRRQKYNLKAGLRMGARWLFHRDGVSMASRLKDGEGRYLWNEGGIRTGDPDRLLGLPVDESEYAPNTFTAGLYVGILANWSYYWIVDSLDLAIQRLDELYAANNQVGFIGRAESDGMPVLENAFSRVKLA